MYLFIHKQCLFFQCHTVVVQYIDGPSFLLIITNMILKGKMDKTTYLFQYFDKPRMVLVQRIANSKILVHKYKQLFSVSQPIMVLINWDQLIHLGQPIMVLIGIIKNACNGKISINQLAMVNNQFFSTNQWRFQLGRYMRNKKRNSSKKI